MQLNDAKWTRLHASGFNAPHLNDAERDWLLDATGEPDGSIPDLWDLFLEQRGFTGQRGDAMRDYLMSEGYLGSHLTDLEYQFWSDALPLPGPLP